jgi:hypothetical protein
MDLSQVPLAMFAIPSAIIGLGWVANTWIRVKHGYPLENSWGKAVYPRNDQAVERVKLLTQENAELRAELGSLKDRMANVERIVTDRGYHLGAEIDALRDRTLSGIADKGQA